MRLIKLSLTVTALFLVSVACGLTASSGDRHVTRAEDAFAEGRYSETIDELEQALEGDLEQQEPEYIYYLMGRSYDQLDEYDQAIVAYQQALEIKPDYADAWIGLGIVHRLSGDMEAALAAYQEALSIDPDLAEAHSSLGTLYAIEGKPEEAIVELEEAVRLDPQLATAHGNLALAYAMVGRFDEADEALVRAAALGYANAEEIQQRIDALKALEE